MSDIDPSDPEWQAVAGAWDRYRERVFTMMRPASDWLVNEIDPQPGQTILELAAGPGETGFLAAERVGETGRLISSDLMPEMLEAARRGAKAKGLTNIEFRVIDAEDIDLPDGSVDGALSRFGIMLLTEPGKALAGVSRVLRPGSRFAYAVMGRPDQNPWMSMPGMALVQSGHEPPFNPFGPGGPFSLADPDANRALLAGAGFSAVTVDQLEGSMTYRDFDEYWDMQSRLSGPIAVFISSLGPEDVAEVRETLRRLVEPFASGTSCSLPSNVVLGAGTA